MNAAVLAAGSIAAFLLAYSFYARFLAKKIFELDPAVTTPAHEFEDGLDHVPTRKAVLFGHHFASIAGLGPIVGPAIAVIWGWLPALLWIVFGTIFFGAVHDFATLVVSIRNKGKSIGDITGEIVGPRAKLLFLFVIFFALALAMGVFIIFISAMLGKTIETGGQPGAVIPVLSLIVIAMLIGVIVQKKIVKLFPATIIGLALMFLFIWIGTRNPVNLLDVSGWSWGLIVYAFIASVLPVWLLLQPRDYLNSFKLYIGMVVMYGALFISMPAVVFPDVKLDVAGAPSLFPFLFIVVACGAISGFHSIVSSGTSAKQLANERDAKTIGYGGMVTEGLLAVIVLISCVTSVTAKSHYSSWAAINKTKLLAFFEGSSAMITKAFGIDQAVAMNFVAVICVAFAMTTLDTGTRLLRYNIEEIGKSLKLKFLGNRFIAAFLAVAAIAFFVFIKVKNPAGNLKPAANVLWTLFGATNQLLAALGLLGASLYLMLKKKPSFYTLIPCLVMLVISSTGLIIKVCEFKAKAHYPLLVVTSVLLILALWLVAEAAAKIVRIRKSD